MELYISTSISTVHNFRDADSRGVMSKHSFHIDRRRWNLYLKRKQQFLNEERILVEEWKKQDAKRQEAERLAAETNNIFY